MKIHRIMLAALSLSLALAGPAAARYSKARYSKAHGHHHAVRGSWDGHWAGAWGGSDPCAINIAGNRVVSFEYGGQTTPVKSSRVTAKKIVYGENDVVVTVIRTGANTAHATLKSSQGNGVAEMVRK